jgi:hypothetical protein
MDLRIAVNFAGRGLENAGLGPLSETKHIDRPMDAGFRGLDRIELVVNRGCRTGEVVNLVNLDVERKRDVVSPQLEVRMAEQVRDVVLRAGEKIVNTEHVVAIC